MTYRIWLTYSITQRSISLLVALFLLICVAILLSGVAIANETTEATDEIFLTSLHWDSAEVGWGQPEKRSFHSFDKTYDRSLFAHSFSKYVYTIDGEWDTFETLCGIRHDAIGTDAHPQASVVFVVKGDDKELFRSETIRMKAVKKVSLDIAGVQKLELIVEDAGNGGIADHGVWFDPKLTRKKSTLQASAQKTPKTITNDKNQNTPPIKIVYFIPADRTASPDAPERLGRVMKYIQQFYLAEMQRNGFGPKTFALEWDAPEKLKLYYVRGEKNLQDYHRNSSNGTGFMFDESRKALQKQGIDAHREVVLIFHCSLVWTGDKAEETGAYVGGGGHLSGTAYVLDDPKLDPKLLTSKQPGGYYGGPCSLGKFNSIYLGGIAHELGHAFSLRHGGETEWEKKNLGGSVMGATPLGMELRGEGVPAFLSKAATMRLSTIRAFAGELQGNREPVSYALQKLDADFSTNSQTKRREINITGRISSSPGLVGIGVFNEDETMGGGQSYCAKSYGVAVDKGGQFNVVLTDLKPVPYTCHFQIVHQNGACSDFSISYSLETGKESSLNEFALAVPIQRLRQAFQAKNPDIVREIAADYKTKVGNIDVQKLADFVYDLLMPEQLVSVGTLPDEIKSADLSFARFVEEKTEWEPLRRCWIPNYVFLRIDKHFFNSGIFAHAKSSVKVDLKGVWQEFGFGYGLQDGCEGHLCFIVRGDGKELFRGEVNNDHHFRNESVSVKDVRMLELIIEPVNGRSGWSIWVNPKLKR